MNLTDEQLEALKNITALYVEDEDDIRSSITTFLKRRMKEVYSAADGNEGLELYKDKKPDVVITDVNMPVMSGLEMARNIKQLDRNAQLIVMTAHSQEDLLMQAIEIGVYRYVIKPVERNNLLAVIYASVENIMLQKELEIKNKKLEEMATIDSLTGIYNRQKFDEIVAVEQYKNKRYGRISSLIMFDIDFFKNVNDMHGHLVGDRVLKEIVDVVKVHIRVSDFFARWGGEEFMILAPETKSEDAIKLAEKLRHHIEEAVYADSLRVTCSFGVSTSSSEDDFYEVIKKCDDALYKAKRGGRNRVEFEA